MLAAIPSTGISSSSFFLSGQPVRGRDIASAAWHSMPFYGLRRIQARTTTVLSVKPLRIHRTLLTATPILHWLIERWAGWFQYTVVLFLLPTQQRGPYRASFVVFFPCCSALFTNIQVVWLINRAVFKLNAAIMLSHALLSTE